MHAFDFGGLVVDDVGRKLVQHRIVCRARLLPQFFDHCYRAFVVRDHQLQEQPVEISAVRCREVSHLLRRRHAGHLVVRMHRVMLGRIRHRLATLAQPALHEGNLITLRRIDASGHVDEFRTIGAIGHQFSHLQRLVMMRDHVAHESRIGRRIAGVGNFDRLCGAELSHGLAGRPGLDDECLREAGGRQAQQQ